MARKDKSKGWAGLYLMAAAMDFYQYVVAWALAYIGIGILSDEITDPICGTIIGLWVQFGKKISLKEHPKYIIWLFASEVVAAASFGYIQTWTGVVYFIHRDVKQEEVSLRDAEAQQDQVNRQNARNMGQSRINIDGSRAASGRQPPIISKTRVADVIPPVSN